MTEERSETRDAEAHETPVNVALRALEPDEIRARRRPRTIVALGLWQLGGAVLVAAPVHAWARAAWGAHPDGDAVLFRPGGYALLTWLGESGPALGTVVRSTLLILFVLSLLGQIVTGALIASLATGTGDAGRAPGASSVIHAGFRAFWPLVVTGAIAMAVEGFFLGVGLFAGSSADHALRGSLGDARAFTARLVVLALFVATMIVVGVVADLARVAIVRDVALTPIGVASQTRLRRGAVAAVETARRALGRASLAWAWRAGIALALLALGALASNQVGTRGGAALYTLFALHQLIALGRAVLRASWLANALRLVTTIRR